jgi:hypothetical protein
MGFPEAKSIKEVSWRLTYDTLFSAVSKKQLTKSNALRAKAKVTSKGTNELTAKNSYLY